MQELACLPACCNLQSQLYERGECNLECGDQVVITRGMDMAMGWPDMQEGTRARSTATSTATSIATNTVISTEAQVHCLSMCCIIPKNFRTQPNLDTA